MSDNSMSPEIVYYRTTIIIDRFHDGTQELVKSETECIKPPCQIGCGCRAIDIQDLASGEGFFCKYDPKTGLCGGRMP